MPVKLVIDSLDSVDEALQSLYVEHSDGKFHLDTDADSVRGHRDVIPLANAFDRTKTELAGLRTKLTEAEKRVAPEGFDLEAWNAFKEGKPEAQYQQQIAQVRQTLEAERDEWKGKFEKAESEKRQGAIERDLSDAIAEAGINNPAFAKAARAMLAPRVAIEGDAGVLDIGLGPMDISEAVKRWAAGDEGKAFVSPPKGDDARGNDRGVTRQQVKGDFGGDRKARAAAIAEKFPDLPQN